MATEKNDKLLPGQKEDGDLEFPFRFPLRKPVPGDGRRVEALELREPTANDVIKHSLLYGMSNESAIKVICDLAEISETAAEQMTAFDLMRLTSILTRFFNAAVR